MMKMLLMGLLIVVMVVTWLGDREVTYYQQSAWNKGYHDGLCDALALSNTMKNDPDCNGYTAFEHIDKMELQFK